jgi:hypothetical protein
MRKIQFTSFFFIIALSVLVIPVSCSKTSEKESKASSPIYTAYNIWKYKSARHMYCINFKSAPEFIPAGTRVYDAKIVTKQVKAGEPTTAKHIQFRIASTNEKVIIKMRHVWHPNVSLEDCFNRMFTSKNFEQITAEFSEDEIEAIKWGEINKGMRKKAVLVTYGYPPEHRTPSLDNDSWIYWITTRKSIKICFDENDRTKPCKIGW